MSAILLFSGGGPVNVTGTDSITVTDVVTTLALAVSETVTAADSVINRTFFLPDTMTASEAATGGPPPNSALTVTDVFRASEALTARDLTSSDAITVRENATVGLTNTDMTVTDFITFGEAAFVSGTGPGGEGGLFNETTRRDRELWGRRFQPGRPV